MVSYFWHPKPIGLNADIELHRAEQQKLEVRIAEIEAIENPSNMDKACLSTYRHLLNQLLQSKADTVDKLGRKS